MNTLHISAGTQTGLVRDHNEDALLVDTDTYRDAYCERDIALDIATTTIIAVADGLGGHNAGEVASMDTATELATHIAALPSILTPDELRTNLDEWTHSQHDYLIEQGTETPSQKGMATTLVAALFYRGRTYLINCGDSRLYVFADGVLRQLSSDHSLYAITHNRTDSNIITNCIGAGDSVFIDFEDITAELRPGARLMLCSDGLTDMLPDARLEELLREGADAHALIDATYEAGARDNVSVILATLGPSTGK